MEYIPRRKSDILMLPWIAIQNSSHTFENAVVVTNDVTCLSQQFSTNPHRKSLHTASPRKFVHFWDISLLYQPSLHWPVDQLVCLYIRWKVLVEYWQTNVLFLVIFMFMINILVFWCCPKLHYKIPSTQHDNAVYWSWYAFPSNFQLTQIVNHYIQLVQRNLWIFETSHCLINHLFIGPLISWSVYTSVGKFLVSISKQIFYF